MYFLLCLIQKQLVNKEHVRNDLLVTVFENKQSNIKCC